MAATEEERWHTLDDGTKLYTKTWKVCDDALSPADDHGLTGV